MQGELKWLPLSQMQCHSCTINMNTIHWMSVMLLWLFQDTQGFVDVHVFFVNITLMILCEANILFLCVCVCVFFFFFQLGKPSAAYVLQTDLRYSDKYLRLFLHVYQVVLCILLCFCSWDILLPVGPLCLWRFFFFSNRAWSVITVLMLYKPKRRGADSCK